MSFTQNLPAIKVKVMRKYLTQVESNDLEEAYLVAVHSKFGRPLLFTVYTERGALFSGLPINAIYCDKIATINVAIHKDLDLCQPYSCLEGNITVVEYNFIKDFELTAKVGKDKIKGNYLFTIDYQGNGLAEDPEQYKTHNIVVLEHGQLAAMPNNYLIFNDTFFKNDNLKLDYKRNTKYYLPGG